MTDLADSRRFSAAAVERFVSAAFQALDVPRADADSVAELMVQADLYGYESHGIFRLRQYVDRLRDGGTNPKARVTIVRDRGSVALIDGDNGLGQLAMRQATGLAIEKARSSGIGWVGVRNSNHAGPAALYVNMPVDHDMIGICSAVGSSNHVPPFGGVAPLLGTNPIAFAVPAGAEPPFVLDMATTVTSVGKIKTLAQRGEPMPEGWMIDRQGKPLTDPGRREEGIMLPIGGAKGYGLAMAIGLLAGTLNGAAFGEDVVDFTTETTKPTNTGQFVAAISVEAFAEVETFKTTVDRIFRSIRASEALPGQEIRIPGEKREATLQKRRADGIPLHPNLVRALSEIASELEIENLA